MALHLRAAFVMPPGIPEGFASVLKDVRDALEAPPRMTLCRGFRAEAERIAATIRAELRLKAMDLFRSRTQPARGGRSDLRQ